MTTKQTCDSVPSCAHGTKTPVPCKRDGRNARIAPAIGPVYLCDEHVQIWDAILGREPEFESSCLTPEAGGRNGAM